MSAPFAAVVGWPANHSLSPLMMRTWLDAAGLEGCYGRVEIPPEQAERFFKSLPDLGWAGVNVTLPHKDTALAAADHATAGAEAIGAANLLTVDGSGHLRADNTDIIGIESALHEDDQTGPAVLIGAGGAARAALFHLSRQDRDITVVNRTRAKAEALVSAYDRPIKVTTDLYGALSGASLVINATSLGMAGHPALVPDLSRTRADALVFDMVYTPLRTGLLTAAAKAGRRTADGLTMLIGQARPSFEAFFGARPPENNDGRAKLLIQLGETP
jgi:shikimate dehydrogenase